MWPFRRKPKPAPPPAVLDLRGLCPRWQRGDLAVCVRDDWHIHLPENPRAGDVLRVLAVQDSHGVSGVRSFFLTFEGKSSQWNWCGTCFRKAVEDAQPAEAEFKVLLKRVRRIPAPDREPA